MTKVACGTEIRLGAGEPSSSGCLVRFLDTPTHLLLLGVAHGLVGRMAQRGDVIESLEAPGEVLGRLETWTSFLTQITADAALVWVDPALVSEDIVGLGAPTGFNSNPKVNDRVRIFPRPASAAPRSANISAIGVDVTVDVDGPGWSLKNITYQKHIICEPMFTQPGDSGSIVLDDQGRVVGLVVAQQPAIMENGRWVSQTIVTPIAAILNHPDFQGQLEILSTIPPEAVAPPPSAALTATLAPVAGAPAGSGFGSLVPGGFFCATPFDLSIPRSIRTNNPGALNFSNWQSARPGFAGRTQPDGSANHNVTTIYRTPEHGVASWYHLISGVYGFGKLASFTLLQLAQHYAGQDSGAAVDGYISGWGTGSGGAFKPITTFAPADEQDMLALAKAMFFNEIGRASPLHDDQIVYAIRHELAGDLPR